MFTKKILLINNDPVQSIICQQNLRKTLNFPVHFYHLEKASRAVTTLVRQQFDLVLFELPKTYVYGVEVLKVIKQYCLLTPVIIVVDEDLNENKELRKSIMDSGVEALFTKESDKSSLFNYISNVLNTHSVDMPAVIPEQFIQQESYSIHIN